MPEPTTSDLARALSALAGRIEYPPTPALAPAVTARLAAQRETEARRPSPSLAPWPRRRLLVALAIGLLALLGIAAATRIVIGAFEIRVRPGITPAPPAPTVDPADLGRPASLAEAEAAAGFRIELPPGLPPQEVYVVEGLAGEPGIVVAWGPGAGYPTIGGTKWSLVLMAFPGEAEHVLKTVGASQAVREVAVDGRRAFWIGAPHLIAFRTEDGTRGPYRVLGGVLIWEAERGITYRLETALPRAEAIALAESLR
jgi:hypothetical protein